MSITHQPSTDWGMNYAGGYNDAQTLFDLIRLTSAPVITMASIERVNYNPLGSLVSIVPGVNMCGKRTHLTLLEPGSGACELPINGFRPIDSCEMNISVKETAGYITYSTTCKIDPQKFLCAFNNPTFSLAYENWLFKRTYNLIDAMLRCIMNSIYAAASPAFSGKVDIGGYTVDIGSIAEGEQFIDFGPGRSIRDYFTSAAAIGDNMPQIADFVAGDLPVWRCEEGETPIALVMPPAAIPLIKDSIENNPSRTLNNCSATACMPFTRGLSVFYDGIRVIPDSCPPSRRCGPAGSNDRIFQTLLIRLKNGIVVNMDMTMELVPYQPLNGRKFFILVTTLYQEPLYIPTECFLGTGGIRLVGPTPNVANCDDLSGGGGDDTQPDTGTLSLSDMGITEGTTEVI